MKLRSIAVILALAAVIAGAGLAAESREAYRVHKGDGLDAIARRHHTSRAALLKMNPLLAPDSLDVGTVINVPKTRVPAERRPSHPVSHAVRLPAISQAKTAIVHPKPPKITVEQMPRTITVVKKPAPIVQLAANKPDAVSLKPKAAVLKPKAAVLKPKAVVSTHGKAIVPKPVATAKPFLADYKEPKKDDSELSLGRVIVDLIWKLALVLGIAYLSIYALRGIMGRQSTIAGPKGRLKVLESAALGPNRAVHLVRVGNKILVLGSTPDQITAIGEVDELEAVPAAAPGAQAFAGHLAEAVAGEKGGALPEQFHGGIRHIWDRVQEIRGLRGKGPAA